MKNEIVHVFLRSLVFHHVALLWLLGGVLLMAPKVSFAYACGTAPAAYTFDGYPAFAYPHCYGNPIYSTTGKDTYTSNPYGNRVMTNSGFGYQCAELAQRYFIFRFRRLISYAGHRSSYGANNLCDNALPARTTRKKAPFSGTNLPVPGDLMVWPGHGGGCGVNGQYGHVAVVDKVFQGKVRVVQQNWGDSPASAIMTFDTSCACAYIHADDNGNQNGPLEAAPPDGGGGGGDGSRAAALNCPNMTDDSDPLKQAGLKSCCVRSEDVQTMWPVPCDGSDNSTSGSTDGRNGSPVGKCVGFKDEINAAANKYGIDPSLLAAIAAQETGGPGSNSGRNIVGDGGHGRGLFQIDDRWHKDFINSGKAMDPAANAMYAAKIFNEFMNRFGGDVHAALSAYNSGGNHCGTRTTWPDGKTMCYADSVLRHMEAIKNLGPECK